ncbi:MAG: putative symporter YjmB [Firmicutes bacterium ADurb.Bin300]|nr:MAG: putative symporter YjmB [Firmicutes bacterium ADurb.Bin300]
MGFFLFNKTPIGEGYAANRNILDYAIGLAGQNIHYSYVSGWLRYFCVNILHMNPKKVGYVFSSSYAWDAVNDPFIGALIDRRKHLPYRKLRPYLLYFPPIIGALSALMFLNVSFDENGKIFYILILYFIWDFFYSYQDVGLWGMIALSSPHSNERARVAQWVSIGAGAGSAFAGLFQLLRSQLLRSGIPDAQVFLIFGIAFGLFGQLLSMRAYKMPELVESGAPEKSTLKSLTVLRHNPTLLLISIARFSLSLSPKIQGAYFFENCVTFMNGQSAEFLFGLLAGIPGAAAIFFANKIAAKIGGMKRILLLSQIAAIAIRIITFFVGFDSPARFIVIILLSSLMNIPGSLMDIAHRTLTSDSIDEVELKTGVRTEGVSFAMQNFISKLSGGSGALIEGFILSKLGYDSFRKNAGLPQSSYFKKFQWPMFILGPVSGALLYLFFISFVKDDKAHKAEVERKLKDRREALAGSESASVIR